MRVFVAGGSGAIGRQLVPKLVVEGHSVVATARSSAKLAEIRAWGANAMVMDGLDQASVLAAVAAAGPEMIVHQMTALATVTDLRHFDRKFALTNRLRTEGTRYLLDAATKTGVRRLVAQGFTGWTNARDGSPVKDETCPLDPHPPKAMRQTLAAFVELEKTVTTATGLEGLVLRYGNFYGPGSVALLDAVRQHKLPVVGSGSCHDQYAGLGEVPRTFARHVAHFSSRNSRNRSLDASKVTLKALRPSMVRKLW